MAKGGGSVKNNPDDSDLVFVIVMVLVIVVCFAAPMCFDSSPAVTP